MSLDFDRSPDGEPLPPAGQAQVPAQRAPATTDQQRTVSPSFTPKHAAGEQAGDEPAGDEPRDDVPAAAEPVLAEPAGAAEPGSGPAVPAAATVGRAAASLDGPLLSDTDEMHASWQRIQVAFIDDPREAVADAAGLVEQTGQALVTALRQRQQQLRAMWDRDDVPDGVDYADSGSPAGTVFSDGARLAADGGPDTEQLRLLIRRYRALFNELCRP
jgi:hypothetical protein